jgi:hypothetical protein
MVSNPPDVSSLTTISCIHNNFVSCVVVSSPINKIKSTCGNTRGACHVNIVVLLEVRALGTNPRV